VILIGGNDNLELLHSSQIVNIVLELRDLHIMI